MGKDVEYYRAGGSGHPELRKFLQGGGSIKPTVRRGVLGDVPSYWEGPGRVPQQGGPPAENNTSK